MRFTYAIAIAAALAAAACNNQNGNDEPSAPRSSNSASTSAAVSNAHAQDFVWGPAPAVFPPGAQMAVLQGDPSTANEFTVRLKLPNGYRIPPHTHPTIENVTVLSGTFLAAMGRTFVDADLKPLGPDAFVSIPAESAHYAMARGETVVQVHAIGPFALTYVNPADAMAR